MQTKVSQIIKEKNPDVLTVDCNASVHEAIAKMIDKNVGSIVAMDKNGEICGIMTERDYVKRVAYRELDPKNTKISDVMTDDVIVVSMDNTARDCFAIMNQIRCRHLPVMEGKKMVGIVSIGDLTRHISKNQEAEIRHLRDYITGKYPG
jgi:CBS domain-containing protein